MRERGELEGDVDRERSNVIGMGDRTVAMSVREYVIGQRFHRCNTTHKNCRDLIPRRHGHGISSFGAHLRFVYEYSSVVPYWVKFCTNIYGTHMLLEIAVWRTSWRYSSHFYYCCCLLLIGSSSSMIFLSQKSRGFGAESNVFTLWI
jgi:hypothetical protein